MTTMMTRMMIKVNYCRTVVIMRRSVNQCVKCLAVSCGYVMR